VLGMVLPPLAWVVWYLKRPRVRFAFDAVPPTVDPGAGFVQPPTLPTSGRIGVVVAAVGTFFLFLVSLQFALDEAIRTSAVYPAVLEQARNSKCIVSVLGTPLTADRGSSGSLLEREADGSANLRIPIHGPKGHGTLLVLAQKQAGVCRTTSLKLTHSSKQETAPVPAQVISCQ